MALKEQDVVLYSTDTSGNKVIQMPITRVENVEGAVRSVNGSTADANGNVAISVPATPKTYVTATWRSGKNWYRKYSDGFIEQGGNAVFSGAISGTVNFNIAFTSTPTVTATAVFSAIAEFGLSGSMNTTSFGWVSNSRGKVHSVEYYACGY